MTPEEKAARAALDEADRAVTATFDAPHNATGWAARAAAYRNRSQAWERFSSALRLDDPLVLRAIYHAGYADRQQAERLERRINEAAR
jgi:hypothetical protein